MSTGRVLGLTRDGIAKFTFLLSAPIILADALYHAKDLKNVPIEVTPFLVAMLTAAVVGILSIKFLLNYLKTKGFGIFSLYRIILGIFIIGIYIYKR